MATPLHETPAPKLPEHLSTARPAATREEKIDRQMEDTFPASDPPSYSGGNHAIGAPVGRESEAATPDTPAVKEAEKKVKDGTVTPDTY
ncbi:MAG: hypothetical protein JO256_00030 [Alphaproteobacteria bacterium]|nr:hypothetical protein [Alphaproteobacteria bacterium]